MTTNGTSPIRPRTADEERQALEAISRRDFATVLVLSDLHLGAGADPLTGRYARRENFFADAAFARFLEAQPPRDALIVLNGDILDFLRIDEVPTGATAMGRWRDELLRFGQTPPPRDLRISRHEERYGLQTGPYKTLWKFRVIADGHDRFFAALARWVATGGHLMYVKGNHDPEQHWPLIRRAFRDELHRHGVPGPDVEDRVAFADEWVRVANVYLEHGHMHERLTRIDGAPELPSGQITLPLGSLVNRYIVNKLERLEPFLDNIKPVTDVLRVAVERHPLAVFGILRRGARFVARAVRHRRASALLLALAILVGALTQLAPAAVALGVVLYVGSGGFRQWIATLPFLESGAARTGLAVAGWLLPRVVRAFAAWPSRFRPRTRSGAEDHCAEGTWENLRRRWSGGPARVAYAVAGHTHQEDVQALAGAGGAPRAVYVNTGTWIPRWSTRRPDLAGRVFHTFARFSRAGDEFTHQLLYWDDSGGVERDAVMLAPEPP